MIEVVPAMRQAAAIPIRNGKICLVTNTSGRRWILPKGHVPPGTSAPILAACEAWEEAGLLGQIADQASCRYQMQKSGHSYEVEVFLLLVTRCVSDWPERRNRRRCWVSIEQAAKQLEPEVLRQAVLSLNLDEASQRKTKRSRHRAA